MAKNDSQIRVSLLDNVSAGLAKIKSSVSGLGGTFDAISSKAGLIGTAISAVATGVGFGVLLGEAINLESAIARAGQATGATAEEMQRLEDAAQSAGEATGFSADKAAEGLIALGKAGLNAQQSITALQPVLALAKTENIALQDAAGRVADTLDQFGLGGEAAAAVVDQLAAAASNSGTQVTQLSDALAQVGPTARNSGISLQEAAAALGVLAQNGLEGGKAGAALRGILEALQDPASKFSQELTKLGISSRDFGTVLDQLGTKGLSAEGAINALSGRGTTALRGLLRDGGGALDDLSGKIQASAGASLAAAQQINDTLGGAFTELKNTLVNTGVDFLNPILDPLKAGIEEVAQAVRDFAATEDFAKLRILFAETFQDGVQFIREFLAEFDFQTALADVQKFATDTAKMFDDVKVAADTLATGVKVAFNGLQVAFNTLDATLNGAVGVLATASAKLLTPLAAVSDEAAALKQQAQDLADTGFTRAGIASDDLAQNMTQLQQAMDGAGQATAKHTEVTKDNRQAASEAALAQIEAAEAAKGATGALDSAGQAQQGVIDGLVTGAQRLAALRAELQQMEAQLVAAQTVGDLSQIEALNLKIREVKQQIDLLAPSAQTAKASLDSAFSSAAAQAGELASNTSEANAALAQTGTTAVQSAGQAGDAIGGLTGLLTGLNAKFGAVSEGARQFFVEAQKNAASAAIGIRGFGESIEKADRGTVEALANAQKYADGVLGALEAMGEGGLRAGNNIQEGVRLAEQDLAGLEFGVKNTVGQFRLMDQQTLSRLQAAIDATRNKVAQLKAEAQQAVDELARVNQQLTEDAARRAGDEAAVLEADFKRRLANIEELEKRAGAAGVAGAAQAKAKLRAEYEAKLADLRAREAEEARSAKAIADNQIRENQRVDQSRRASGPAGGTSAGGGNTQGSAGGFGSSAAAPGDTTININVDRTNALEDDEKFVERLARRLLPKLNQLSARTR